jgi:hypothetical protein
MTDAELINALRRAASVWFKNSDLLMLEELIRRFERRPPPDQSHTSTIVGSSSG